ncbi:MAG TPA: TAXI family TRAP transporter solute-binding subunit [Chloroflexota bacterium]|jgi:TRAP-type uncharacterized transport system substrate-binding protein
MEGEPGLDAKGRRLRAEPVTIRSMLMLEVASELVNRAAWEEKQSTIHLRKQGAPDWAYTLFASDTPNGIDAVVRGEADVAIVNPAEPLTLAYRGTGPYTTPQPVRVITNIPSYDQFAFGVTEGTGLSSLAEIKERHYPLKVSLRGQRDHSVHWMLDLVLKAAGFTLDDLRAWGGEVRYDPGLPNVDGRIGAVARGEVEAIFDEAVGVWVNPALDLGMRFLEMDPPIRRQMEEAGWRFSVMPQQRYPKLPGDLEMPDFSGWPVFCRADASDEFVTAFCDALDQRRDRIPWQGGPALPLETMAQDRPENPLDVPLHPAAERYWRQRGYLP